MQGLHEARAGIGARLRDELNFLLTNRIPRRAATLFVGWLSRIEHPWVCAACLAVWRLFGELDLSDARKARFSSMHDCFTRELRDGARPLDPDPDALLSPSDAIVGASGRVTDGMLLQAKGFAYSLRDLLGDTRLVDDYEGCTYTTLRLTAGMYHRFHAPTDCCVEHVTYFSGDTWNVNPVALARVERLFCRNERAAIRCRLPGDEGLLTLVPVAAILVASLRLRFLDVRLHLRYRGPNEIDCDVPLRRGEQMGWFEHGSTIIVFAPRGWTLAHGLESGQRIRMGEALLHRH